MRSCGCAFINTCDFLEECILGLILIFFPNYWLIRNKVLQRKAFMLLNFMVCSEGQNEEKKKDKMFWKTWEMGSFDVPGTAQRLGSVSAALHSLPTGPIPLQPGEVASCACSVRMFPASPCPSCNILISLFQPSRSCQQQHLEQPCPRVSGSSLCFRQTVALARLEQQGLDFGKF